MDKLSFAMENYLETIYELSGGGAGARISDIAQRLGVAKASANNAMSTLAQKGLITNEKYKEVFLTEKGRQIAELTSKKHHVIRRYFTEILNIDPAIADEDACAIEHVISDRSIEAMQTHLQNKKDGPVPK